MDYQEFVIKINEVINTYNNFEKKGKMKYKLNYLLSNLKWFSYFQQINNKKK